MRSIAICTSVNPFSRDYVSQITPFATRVYKKPLLKQPDFDIRSNIAIANEGKKMRMRKASI